MFIEKIASFLVFSVPYIIVAAGYLWLFRKILRLHNPVWKIVSLIVWLFGCSYTIITLINTIHEIFDPMNFDLVLIAINCFIMLLVAVALALGTPQADPNKPK